MRDQTQDQVFDISRRRFIQAVGIAGVYAISTQLITPLSRHRCDCWRAFKHQTSGEFVCCL